MEDYEMTLFDRLAVIRDTIAKYGENNFYVSFSGGKDSTIIHHLVDMAIPGNKIPRVFINTGIEYVDIAAFVRSLAASDSRFVIVNPIKPINQVLEKYGYPFKSKEHSLKIGQWQKGMKSPNIIKYVQGDSTFSCPRCLRYQGEQGYPLHLSNQCCYKLKKEPAHAYEKRSGRSIPILGLRIDEGGQRSNHKGCAIFDKKGKLMKFKPLNPVSDEWEAEFIRRNKIRLCDLYYPPYNFKRTGCKGCPYAIDLQEQLTTMSLYLPNERKQCEIIWKKVYDEYRRVGYRLKANEQLKLL